MCFARSPESVVVSLSPMQPPCLQAGLSAVQQLSAVGLSALSTYRCEQPDQPSQFVAQPQVPPVFATVSEVQLHQTSSLSAAAAAAAVTHLLTAAAAVSAQWHHSR